MQGDAAAEAAPFRTEKYLNGDAVSTVSPCQPAGGQRTATL